MLHNSLSDQQFTAHQRQLNSPPFNPLHSNLTAALQASNDGNVFPTQLSPVSQVSDLAVRGENEEQYFPGFNTSAPVVNLKPAQDSIEPFPNYDDATYDITQYAPREARNVVPWSHLRAFSAPDPLLVPFSDQPETKSPSLNPCSPGAIGSFEGSWNSYHVQSLNLQNQSNSYGAVNETFWPFDDTPSPNIEHGDLGLDHTQAFRNFDRSRASSISKPTNGRSQREYPLSPNLSADENAIQIPFTFPLEGVDKDEKADAAHVDGFMSTYQADSESLLNGLKSPVHHHQGLRESKFIFNDSQNYWQWSMNEVSESVEGPSEMFPGLPESNISLFQSFTLDSDPVNEMSIQTSNSDSLEDGMTISSPQTALDHSPHQARDTISIVRSRRTTLPMASSSTSHTDRSILPFSASSTKAKAIATAKRSRRSSINESRKPLSPTLLAPALKRGGRVGSLDPTKAEQIKLKRQTKTICIRCRMKRIGCIFDAEDLPCQHCLRQGCRCIRADFAEMTSAQTCNFIFQTSLSHITLDGLRRRTITYSAIIDADWLKNHLAIHHKSSNIEIRSITGAVWEINLGRCYDLISKLPWQQGVRRLKLDDLVHNRRMPIGGWLDCMVPGKEDSEFEQLLKYTNMPNKNTYSLLPLNKHLRSRVLDVENPGDRDLVLMAAQLCRVILRALELKGFKTLQKELSDISRFPNISDRESIILRTGRLLATLRWRLALWKIYGSGSVGLDSNRVKKITWSLYFWFLFAKQQLPAENQDNFPTRTSSYYAETESVWDDFPQDGSPEGFETWLLGAHSLIQEGLASAATKLVGPEQLIQMPNFLDNATFQEPPQNWQLPMEPRKISYDDSETNMTWEFK